MIIVITYPFCSKVTLKKIRCDVTNKSATLSYDLYVHGSGQGAHVRLLLWAVVIVRSDRPRERGQCP